MKWICLLLGACALVCGVMGSSEDDDCHVGARERASLRRTCQDDSCPSEPRTMQECCVCTGKCCSDDNDRDSGSSRSKRSSEKSSDAYTFADNSSSTGQNQDMTATGGGNNQSGGNGGKAKRGAPPNNQTNFEEDATRFLSKRDAGDSSGNGNKSSNASRSKRATSGNNQTMFEDDQVIISKRDAGSGNQTQSLSSGSLGKNKREASKNMTNLFERTLTKRSIYDNQGEFTFTISTVKRTLADKGSSDEKDSKGPELPVAASVRSRRTVGMFMPSEPAAPLPM